VHRPLRRKPAALGDLLEQVVPFDVAHRQVKHAVLLPGVKEGDDVGVVERRRDPALGLEPLAERRVVGELGRDQLQRHGPLEVDVECPVDDAHPAAAGQLLDLVGGEHRSWRELGHSQVVMQTVRANKRRRGPPLSPTSQPLESPGTSTRNEGLRAARHLSRPPLVFLIFASTFTK